MPFALITLPHTGTTFMRSFFKIVPGIDGERQFTLLGEIPPAVYPEGNIVFWDHFTPESWPWMASLCRQIRPIVPMRDPLLVATSHATRGNPFIIKNWIAAPAVLDAHNAYYLPLDLVRTEEEQILALRGVLKAGIWDRCETINACRKWARDWNNIKVDSEKAHTQGMNSLKAAYEARDFDFLKHEIPGALQDLRHHERTLRPWLERMGYRDLIWWSS